MKPEPNSSEPADASALKLLLKGDAPLIASVDDEFGFAYMATKLAETLSQRIAADGYSLGVEGRWGSGKSTLINFVIEELQQSHHQHIIRFEPWLIGEKNALLAAFFGQFASRIDNIEVSAGGWWLLDRWRRRRIRKILADKIRSYGESLAVLATPVGGLAAADPTGTTALAAVGLKSAGLFSRLFKKTKSLDQLKSEIIQGLKEIREKNPKTRFIVIIDDVDRLEPTEAVELLRLIRKVADFPLTSYLICFDMNILSGQIETVLQIDSGRLFIEKIFQEVLHMPPQEPFALRRYLTKLLDASFPDEMNSQSKDRDYEYRKHLVLDIWAGKLIETPRDVVRLHEAVSFGWPSVPPHSDFFDFLWLQLIKQKSHRMYSWTQDYLQNVGAYRDGGRAGDIEPTVQAVALSDILRELQWDDRPYLSGLDNFVPGINSFALTGENKKVFSFTASELETFERNRRLGSPSHWRQYFAFDLPSYAIKDDEVAAFRMHCAKGEVAAASALLMSLLARRHDKTGHFVDVLLDRILDISSEHVQPNEAVGLLLSMIDSMDVIISATGQIRLTGSSELWRKAALLIKRSAATAFLQHLKTGKSINWLAYVVRDQGFAHGLPSGSRQLPEKQWLTRSQLDEAVSLILSRFRAMGLKEIFSLPNPQDVLFCWLQLGDEVELRALFQRAIQRNNNFLLALNSLRGWSNSSDVGVHHPLREEYVEMFTDAALARERLENLSERVGSKSTLVSSQATRAKEILENWESSRRGS